MQRRVEQADRHRQPGHDAEQLDEILPLERQQLLERGAAAALVVRHDHLPHRADALGIEEHVLGAAEADALGAELARGLGVERRFGVGAHAQAADASAHSISVPKSPDSAGSIIATAPTNTSPVAPSSVIVSPRAHACGRRPRSVCAP